MASVCKHVFTQYPEVKHLTVQINMLSEKMLIDALISKVIIICNFLKYIVEFLKYYFLKLLSIIDLSNIF